MAQESALGIRGYPGLSHTAEVIASYFPTDIQTYVEPFAGLARTAKYIKAQRVILNDKSDYAVKQLKRRFPYAVITQEDYLDCINRWDGVDAFMLIDPPWRNEIYQENTRTFIDDTVRGYYEKLLALFPTLKARWMLCAGMRSAGESLCRATNYYKADVYGRTYEIFGKRARTLILSPKPLVSKMKSLDLYINNENLTTSQTK